LAVSGSNPDQIIHLSLLWYRVLR